MPETGSRRRRTLIAVTTLIAIGSLVGLGAQARRRGAFQSAAPADWLLWGGPQRNFIAPATGVLARLGGKWIEAPPSKLWERALGDGYSAIAVEDGALYTAFRRGDSDVVIKLDAASGRTIWEFAYAAPFQNAYADAVGPGPYAMPQVVGDRVVAVSGVGQIHSIDKSTGKPVWSIDLYRQFGGERLPFGYSSHPLPFGDSLIVQTGGENAVLRIRQRDGTIVWQRQRLQAGHPSPILIDVDGRPQVAMLLANGIAGIDPETGDLLWRHPHVTDNGLAVSTPLRVPGNRLFVSSAYGGGARLLKLTRIGDKTEVFEVWHNRRVQAHFGTAILDGGHIYLSSGQSIGLMTAVELETGRIVWQARDFTKAQLVSVDGRLIVLDEDGHLGLAVATPARFQAFAKWAMLSNVSWTPPTVAGRRLYLRDRRVIMALDLGTLQ